MTYMRASTLAQFPCSERSPSAHRDALTRRGPDLHPHRRLQSGGTTGATVTKCKTWCNMLYIERRRRVARRGGRGGVCVQHVLYQQRQRDGAHGKCQHHRTRCRPRSSAPRQRSRSNAGSPFRSLYMSAARDISRSLLEQRSTYAHGWSKWHVVDVTHMGGVK